MIRKLSLIMVVVMLGVMLSGCSGEVTLESYTEDFIKASDDFRVARGEFVDELNESMERLSMEGVAAVSAGDAKKASKKLTDLHAKFEKMEPYEGVAEAHSSLAEYYGAFASRAVGFADALDNKDTESAMDLVYELESIDFDLALVEMDMYDQLGIQLDF